MMADEDEQEEIAAPPLEEPAAKPEIEPPKPIGLTEMVDALSTEAAHRMSTIHAREKMGDVVPEETKRHAQALFQAAIFIENLRPILPEIRQLLKPVPKQPFKGNKPGSRRR